MRKDFAYSETDGHIYAGSAAWRTVNTLEMEIRRMDGLSGGRMIVRFQKENLLLEAEDTLTRHFTASGTDGFRNKRVLNKKMRKAKEELSNWIVLFSFYVCYNYTKGEIQERVWENI